MSNHILLLTKDALCRDYLPVYGNKYWKGKTPNLDELAAKGTVYTHFVTAAPSTVMAFRSMMFGLFGHEQSYKDYSPKEVPEKEDDFFVEAVRKGYSCHIIWDKKWDHMALRFGNCFGKDTQIHSLPDLRQGVGVHYIHKDPIVADEAKSEKAIEMIMKEVREICSSSDKALVWIHLPHVLNGRTGYGSDIDIYDLLVGKLRTVFDDDNIFISADHGNMNGFCGKFSYGFDVHPSVIFIPLITPRFVDGLEVCDKYISNVDMKKLVLYRQIPERKFIYSDCSYYAQPYRELTIIHNGFAYLYSKSKKKESLFDLEYDPTERVDLISDSFYDVNRKLSCPLKEVYLYDKWDKLEEERKVMREEFRRVWRTGPFLTELKGKLTGKAKRIVKRIIRIFKKK